MPIVKIHISSTEVPAVKPLLTKRIREILVEKLQIDEKIGQVLLYDTLPQYRAIHSDRSNNFVFMEILMYSGRTFEMKSDLMHGLVDEVHKLTKVEKRDINCCITEIPQENWYSGIKNV